MARRDAGDREKRTPAPHNLPLHGFDQNQIWCAIVQLARRTRLRFSAHAPWAELLTLALKTKNRAGLLSVDIPGM